MTISDEQLILILIAKRVKNAIQVNKLKRKIAKQNKVGMLKNAELLSVYKKMVNQKKIEANAELEDLLRKRKIRTLSGVAPIAVLTKPFPCPGKCVFCPGEKEMPKSYLSNEPAVMRAIMTKFDPFRQVAARIKALQDNGHDTNKLELIIMGGTWSYLPRRYRRQFVKRCYDAANERAASDLPTAQRINETGPHRIVAMTVETRPDYVTETEINFDRELGATKVELGVQTVNEKALESCGRGHGVKQIADATALLRQSGFKIAYHIMPNLPTMTPQKDLASYKKLFSDPRFQPDFIKIYPTVITAKTKLWQMWKKGEYKPYNDRTLRQLLKKMKLSTPRYVRIIRLIRDIPEESIIAGNKTTNLRELLQKELLIEGKKCQCIRCREAREKIESLSKAKLSALNYPVADGKECFFEFSSANKQKLYAFLRLTLPDKGKINFNRRLTGAAMIREVHTYGRLSSFKNDGTKKIQHHGLGTLLTLEAENAARQNGFAKIAVISGVGVRNFYRKLGYRKCGTYLIKTL